MESFDAASTSIDYAAESRPTYGSQELEKGDKGRRGRSDSYGTVTNATSTRTWVPAVPNLVNAAIRKGGFGVCL